MRKRRALISGITGQDGSYLAELLLAKGYEVHGIVRRASLYNRSRIEHLRRDPQVYGHSLFLHYADLTDATTLRRIFAEVQPEEFYHLAGQSHVGLSFEIPESTVQEVAVATLSLLEICRDQANRPRIYHASSSEVFGDPPTCPQDLSTPFRPVNPYGCAKTFSTQMARVYRESYGLFVVSGIAYNHESPRRGENFVTRKITRAAVHQAQGSGEVLWLGNLDAARDWGAAPEYVEAMWQSLQTERPRDWIFATGQQTTVREFARAAYAAAGVELEWKGEGPDEVGVDRSTGEPRIAVDPRFYRKVDSPTLVGDPGEATQQLLWRARRTGAEVARWMVQEEWHQQNRA